MKIFITDEANLNKDDKFEFFVYGGLVINEDAIKDLSTKLILLKQEFGVDKNRPIKWSNINWSKKGELDPELHKKIKDRMISEVVSSNCKIIIYLAPQDFHHNRSLRDLRFFHTFDQYKYIRSQKYAMNVCCHKFDQLLQNEDQYGLVFADTFMKTINKDMTDYCASLYPDGGNYEYKRIAMPIMQLDNEHSLLHQFNDVILGAITCSMREMSFNFLPKLKNSFYKDNENKINRYGINIYPKQPKTQEIEKQLLRLRDKFERLLNANDNISISQL